MNEKEKLNIEDIDVIDSDKTKELNDNELNKNADIIDLDFEEKKEDTELNDKYDSNINDLNFGETRELSEKHNKKKKSFIKKIIIILITLFIFGIGSVAFLLYGPYSGFRNWLITTAMTTMNHQYFATWFYSDATIQKVLSENQIIESGEDTDVSLIKVGKINFKVGSYANKYEKEILNKENGNNDYKLINISGKGYKGYLVAIYDPSKVSVMTTKYLGVKGQYLTTMSKDNNALVAINGGGFVDPNYSSLGGEPHGIVISKGKIIKNNTYTSTGGLIGFTNDNVLVLGKMTAQQALNKGVRDAVTFGPFLIVNGVSSFIKGNGGWGTAPRTAIGQRADGIVLFLVIEGRTLRYPGADMCDLTEIMENYGAVNAANLDGGTSSALTINSKLINDPIDSDGKHETRIIPTAFALIK